MEIRAGVDREEIRSAQDKHEPSLHPVHVVWSWPCHCRAEYLEPFDFVHSHRDWRFVCPRCLVLCELNMQPPAVVCLSECLSGPGVCIHQSKEQQTVAGACVCAGQNCRRPCDELCETNPQTFPLVLTFPPLRPLSLRDSIPSVI